jgi:4-amino-4-deoxy-L-arabinose transferase-like glycosyltransferase
MQSAIGRAWNRSRTTGFICISAIRTEAVSTLSLGTISTQRLRDSHHENAPATNLEFALAPKKRLARFPFRARINVADILSSSAYQTKSMTVFSKKSSVELSVRPDRLSEQLTSKRKTLLLLSSAAIAIVSHVVFLLVLPSAWQRNQEPDFTKYYEPVAQTLAAGGGFVIDSKPALLYPLGFPLMYAATFRIADALHIARSTGLKILEALLSAFSGVLVCLLALLILSWKVAFLASAVWSTYPFHLWLSKQPDSTSAVSLLLLLGVFIFLKWSVNGHRSLVYGPLTGLVIGISALVKPITIGLPAVIAGIAWICVVRCRARQRALFSVSLIIAYMLLISPWELWARSMSGKWIPLCTNGPNVLIDGVTLGAVRGLDLGWIPPGAKAITQDAIGHYSELKSPGSIASFLLAKARAEPIGIAELVVTKAARSWYGSESRTFETWVLVIQVFYLPFIVLGAREMSGGDRQQRNFLLIVTATTLYFWAMTTFVGLPLLRYLVPPISLVLIFAALGIERLTQRLFIYPLSQSIW